MRFMMQSPDGREQRLVSEADTSRVLEAGGSFVKLGDGKPVAVPDEPQNGGPPNSELFGHWAKRTAVGSIPAAASTMAQIAASPIAASVGAMTGPAAPVTATGIEAIAAGLGAIPGKFAQQAIEGRPLSMAQALREAQMMGALSVGGKALSKIVGAGGKGLASASLERAAKQGAAEESIAAAQAAKAAGRAAPKPIDLPQEMVDRRVFSPAVANEKRAAAAARTQAFLDENAAGPPTQQPPSPVATASDAPVAGPEGPTDPMYLANIHQREARAAFAISEAAKKSGADPIVLRRVALSRVPNNLDLALLQGRYGMSPQEINALREFAPTFSEATGASMAGAEASTGRAALVNTPGARPAAPPRGGGPVYRARDFVPEVQKEILRLSRESTTPAADVAEMKGLLRDFLRAHRNSEFTAAEANKIKQFGGTVAGDKVVRAGSAGKNITASATNVKLFNEAMRRGIQKRIEQDLPAVAPLNAETRAYIRLQDAFRHSPGLPAQLAPYAVGSLAGQGFGHPLEGLAAGAATHAIVDPAVQRRLAQLLTSPAMRAMLNLGPKAIPPGLASSLPPDSTGWNQ